MCFNAIGNTCRFADEIRGGHCTGDAEEHFSVGSACKGGPEVFRKENVFRDSSI